MINIKKTGPIFLFYDEPNQVLYLGMQNSDKIFCLEYNKNRRSMFLSQVLQLNNNILSICVAPKKLLDVVLNEVLR